MLKTNQLKPLLKWAGGKTKFAPIFQKLYTPRRHRRLVEPFCGGLGVALGLMPDRALLNDVNVRLIEFYEYVQTPGFDLNKAIPNTGIAYYMVRDRMNESEPHYCHSAQDFYYLNRTAFNGLCRFNRKGEFNAPYGKYKSPILSVDLEPYRLAFAKWDFSRLSYNYLSIENDDFIIVDSPYDSADDKNKAFTSYSGNTFGWIEQVELANWLDRQPKIPQVACNLATDRIIKLYTDRGWDIEYLEVGRSISCDGNRKKVTEMLATRYL
jgi:DNA adenine methylase